MSSEALQEQLEHVQRQLLDFRQVLWAKRDERDTLLARVTEQPELASQVAQLNGVVAVLEEVEPQLVAKRDEARRTLAHRQRWEVKKANSSTGPDAAD